MSLSPKSLFDLDKSTRTYLRFVIETLAMIFVYVVWLSSIQGFGKFDSLLHTANLIIWFLMYNRLGLNKDRIRFSNLNSYFPILKVSLISGAVLMLEHYFLFGTIDFYSFSFVLLLSSNLLVGMRVIARQIIRSDLLKSKDNVLVYGTSEVAIDLVNAMAFGKKYNVVGFINDIPDNIKSLAGLPVVLFKDIESFAVKHNCKLVVLASQVVESENYKETLLKIDKLGLSVSAAPTMDRAFDYEVKLKAVKPEDVLGRLSDIKVNDDVSSEIRQKTILVTGAGGSIGSEICRQILKYQPEALIILELNEFALYTLEQELTEVLNEHGHHSNIYYHLGSVLDEVVVEGIFQKYSIDIIYHAAAYKHVPILEENIIAGVRNNVFGTKLIADFAHRFGIGKFVLISTDKAVRPTNVMGASKRLAELVIQDFSNFSDTVFTMVRFGNVLGSSGSVIPKFKSQINAGGPITVTHEEITRYFMSIPEAAHLVLNAGTLARGGEVFLLDMGEPVKILDLAKTMVRQHGLQPVLPADLAAREKRKNELLIDFTGLRPGEKLYEELLVDGVSQKTANPKIFKSDDGRIEGLDLLKELHSLEKNVNENRPNAISDQLTKLPINYRPADITEPQSLKDDRLNHQKSNVSRVADKYQPVGPLANSKDKPSLLKLITSTKIGLAILHRYFLITRGMTLGVRVIVENKHGEILIVKHSYVQGWHLPGGGVDLGEDVENAARREIFEETGISELDDLKFLGLDFNKAVSRRDHVAYFKASTKQNETGQQTAEILESRFAAIDELYDILPKEQQKFLT